MGERTGYTPGTFSWAELSTSEPDGAKRFYAALFGWDYDDRPIPDGSVYTMARRDGKEAAALYAAREGMPTAWATYVTVESADATAARARELGATVLAEPFDVLKAGRMAVIQDPTGAIVSVWEPRESIGRDGGERAGGAHAHAAQHARPGGGRGLRTASCSAGGSTWPTPATRPTGASTSVTGSTPG
jgi:predicted enzyme related to lactoylglutathione lyase